MFDIQIVSGSNISQKKSTLIKLLRRELPIVTSPDCDLQGTHLKRPSLFFTSLFFFSLALAVSWMLGCMYWSRDSRNFSLNLFLSNGVGSVGKYYSVLIYITHKEKYFDCLKKISQVFCNIKFLEKNTSKIKMVFFLKAMKAI